MSTFESHAGVAPHRGTLILVLGILSLVACQILGPFAWIMGKGDMAKINAGQMDPEGKGITQAGMICGIIGTCLVLLPVLLLLMYIISTIVLIGIGAIAAAASAGAGP